MALASKYTVKTLRAKTVPEEKILSMADRYFDPNELGPPEMSSTSYNYSYESTFEKQPDVADADELNGDFSDTTKNLQMENGFVIVQREEIDGERMNVERQQKQTQKVTRTTKVTTTRTVQHIPVDHDGSIGNVEYHIGTPHEHETNSVHEHVDQYHHHSHQEIPSFERDTPSQPGSPQVVDVDVDNVTLVWLRPDRNGDAGVLHGYQIQYRLVGELHWHVANTELVTEPLYTIRNLQENGEYELRIVARNAAGFGEPSPVSIIHLRPNSTRIEPHKRSIDKRSIIIDPNKHPTNTRRSLIDHNQRSNIEIDKHTNIEIDKRGNNIEIDKRSIIVIDKHSNESDVPTSPGRPRVTDCDGTSVLLTWEPPITSGRGGPVAGYLVEYRVIRTHTWISATDYLVQETRYRVTGLRPNGEYEFRVLAKNADGFSPPSQSSGEIVIIKPQQPDRRSIGHREGAPDAPSQPQITDVDSDMVTLFWAPAPSAGKHDHDHILQDMQYILEYREMGDINWYSATDRPIWGTQFTIGNLHRNSTYEFRVFARNRHGLSEASEISELCQLRPKFDRDSRTVPSQPNQPELMEIDGDCVTLCWAPVRSSVPLQGYQLEFRDLHHPPHEWLAVNNILSHSCKMSVGDLVPNGVYEFRVMAKNAMGYSKPSEPSERIVIKPHMETAVDDEPLLGSPLERDPSFSSDAVPLPVEIDTAKESPPITDTDDSPPPIRRKHDGRVRYRDPTLPEVLDYLTSSNKVLKLNASGYLQHLTYNHDANKNKVRELDGIPRVIELLRSDEVPEIQRNASGCLRNLSYGNDENKKAILNAGGVPALGTLMRKTPDMQVIEEISCVLWNLSSHDDLKMPVLQHAVEPLIKQIVIPYSGWSATGRFTDFKTHPLSAFRNSTGTLRNISSANSSARKTLREREGLIDALVHYLHMSCDCGEVDTKSVENVICVLRNLSYRLQEIEDPNYDKKPPPLDKKPQPHERSKSAPSSSPKVSKKKSSKSKKGENGDASEKSPLFKQPATGIALVWQPEVVRYYLKLLDQSTNPDTLEGSAGTIQNLSACYWQPSVEIRNTVRREKGLPVLVALLSIENDKVVCAAATALRNLSLDPKNKELIGKYALNDLVKKLPTAETSTTIRDASYVSDDTVASILSVVYATTSRNPEFARAFLEKKGVERLVFLSGSKQYSQRVSRYASQILYAIWQHRELHDLYKKAGFREEDFVSRVSGGRGPADTLARPVSTQGIEGGGPKSRVRPDWGDDYSSRSRAPSAMNVANQEYGGSRTPPTPQARTPTNGQQTPHSTTSEPAYSQVQKKQNRQQLSVSAQSPGYTNGNGARSPMAQPQQQALDSWV